MKLTILSAMDFNGLGNRKQGKLSNAFPSHHLSPETRPPALLLPPLISNEQVLIIRIIHTHSVTIIGDSDFSSDVDLDLHVPGIGVPSIGDHLREHRRDIAVQANAQVLQNIETQGHAVGVFGISHRGYSPHEP